jgi:hypothetical protein
MACLWFPPPISVYAYGSSHSLTMEARTISQADQSAASAWPGSTAANPAGGLSQCVTLCGTAHSTLSAITASAYHKQRQHGMGHNGIDILRITASTYRTCRNCDMRHNGSVISDMPHLAYAFSSIGRYAPIRIRAYYGSVIPSYAHMPISA